MKQHEQHQTMEDASLSLPENKAAEEITFHTVDDILNYYAERHASQHN